MLFKMRRMVFLLALAIQNYYQHYSVMKYLGKEGRHRLKHGARSEVMVGRYQEVLNYGFGFVYGYYFNIFQWSIVDHQGKPSSRR